MPELPEVETVKRVLENELIGRTISKVDVFRAKNIVTGKDSFVSILPGKKISSLKRIGKFLLYKLTEGYTLVAHLRMEGKYFIKDEDAPINKHDIFAIYLDNSKKIVYQDVRKFGGIGLYLDTEIYTKSPIAKLGPEPFEYDANEFLARLKKKNGPIKEALLDQSLISGIGNIYADETLFRSKINPRTPAKYLTKEEAKAIIENASKVMDEAIKLGGSTIHSFQASEGINGAMQNELLAYGHKGEKCPNCSHPFRKIVVGGRGTTYCPICQKDKKMPYLVLITGPIHSGKSYARAYLTKLGYIPFDADQIVKSLYKKEDVKKKAKEIIGKSVIKNNEFLATEALSIFDRNPKILKNWERYLHPLVKKEIIKELKAIGGKKKVVFECQLPFDLGFDNLADEVLLIEASQSAREARLFKETKNASKYLKLNDSYPLKKARQKATSIILNEGSLKDFEKKIKEIHLP